MKVCTLQVTQLSPAIIGVLWEMYRAYYDNVHRDIFERDLANKDVVFIARNKRSLDVVGFSTARIYKHRYGGRTVGVYYSGDTVVTPEYWGKKALHNAVTRYLLSWKLRHPTTPLYWFLVCSGYRTYLNLVRNVPNHHPHYAHGLPEWERGFIADLGQKHFPEEWRDDLGVVRQKGEGVILKKGVAPFTKHIREFPEIQFFERANPDHELGDELGMIGCIDASMLACCAQKSIHYTWRNIVSRSRAASAALEKIFGPS